MATTTQPADGVDAVEFASSLQANPHDGVIASNGGIGQIQRHSSRCTCRSPGLRHDLRVAPCVNGIQIRGVVVRQRGSDGRTGRTIGSQIHEADFAQRRSTNHVQRPLVLSTVDGDLLILSDEFELLDRRSDRCLPWKAVSGAGNHLASGRRVSRHQSGCEQLPLLHSDRIGVTHTGQSVVTEADRTGLRRDRKASQINHDRMPPARHPHGRSGVSHHLKAGQS